MLADMAAGEDVGSGENQRSGNNQTGQDGIQAESFTLKVLHLIKEAQQQHGLRHGDFQRYRQYCGRRIRRIRKSLHFLQGTRHKVIPKKITQEMLTDIRYLYLPLVDAERAWSYAMQLKAEANTEPRKKFRLLSKLKKAVTHTETLSALCDNDMCDARTKLEVQAYSAWMKGSLKFEVENWKEAIELFNKAKTIYAKLSEAFVDEEREIYLQRVEELAPNIRYCAYNIGDESAIEDLRQMRLKTAGREDPLTSRLDELIEKTREKSAATLSEVTWRGRTAPVKNEAVRVFLLSVQESEKQMKEAESNDGKLSILESLLKELIDAQQSLRDELRDDQAFKAALRGQQTEEKVSNAVYLYTYLSYIKLTKTIERNLLMIEQLKAGTKTVKPQDLARLYDIIIQSLTEIPSLPGVEEDQSLIDSTEVQIQGYKAFRCFYIAQMYAVLKKWKESVALYERVLVYAQEAKNRSRNIKEVAIKKLGKDLEELTNQVDGLKYSVHAASILDVEDVTAATGQISLSEKKKLSQQLDVYNENVKLTGKKPELVQFPPDFEPISCKPLFFDLASSHVQMPSLDDKLEQKKQGSGITGLVKGWLWGSKK